MGDKPLPKFSFGAPASSNGAGSSLFGTAPGNTGSSLFGNNTNSSNLFGNTGGSGGGFSLGKAPAATSGEENKSIFGVATDSNKSTSMFAPSPNGSGANSPFSLGGATGASSSGGFGGFNFAGNSAQTPAKLTSSADTTSTTPAAKPFAGFGVDTSTTPAGVPPTSVSFGASTGENTSSIFSNLGPRKPSSTHTATQSQTPLFSTKSVTSGFSLGPLAPTPQAGAPATGSQAGSSFSFPAPSQTAAASSSGSATSNGQQSSTNLFANPSPFSIPASTQSTASSEAPTQTPLFAGFGMQNQPSTTAASGPQTAATTTTAPSAAPIFGFATTGAPPASSSAITTTTAPAPGAGFSFLGGASASSAQPATTAAPNLGGFTLGCQSTSSTTQPTTATAPALPINSTFTPNITNNGPLPTPQSRLKNKTMDEILTRWASDLTKYTKDFRTHAEMVSQWDQKLVANLSETAKIYGNTVKSEKQMQSVEMALSTVEKQQDELEGWLARYERDVDEMMAKNSAGQTEMAGPDQERERTYKLAERLGERLDDMDRDLVSMIEEVNSVTASISRNGGRDEPITQIVKILNSHLTQLQEIDQGTAALQAKVTTAQKTASQLGYSNGTTNGDGRAAVEDFYRSYMGRR